MSGFSWNSRQAIKFRADLSIIHQVLLSLYLNSLQSLSAQVHIFDLLIIPIIIMKKYQTLLILALLLLACYSSTLGKNKNIVQDMKGQTYHADVGQTNNGNVQAIPKLPMYLGSSYNLINGNPKNQYGIDPGFAHPVFNYQYTDQSTTQDGKYLIPNGISARKMSSCSFTTDINAFRGTKSYQTDLHSIATLSASQERMFDSAAFSFSRSYQKIQNSTIQQKTTITHATAQCQTYQLIIDMFKLPPLTDAFTAGVLQSYAKKNWTQFTQEFGSHFVHQIIVGGRATQQTVYSFESVSKLESLEVDISITAKASFAQFLADASFDYKKYDRQIQYSQKMSTTKSQQYIGGAPPKTGNIYDWQQKIIDNPMPIKYKLLPITVLFENVSNQQFDSKQATADFNQALQDFCTKINCKPPTPDLPKPDPATVLTTSTESFGNGGGQQFQSINNSTTLDLKKINIRSSDFVINLQLLLSDGVTQLYTPAVGGLGGKLSTWTVPDNQFVTQIQYRSGTSVDSLTFITNMGNKSPRYGGTGGQYNLVTLPEGYRIVGFFGSYKNILDKLGFYLCKTVYPEKGMNSAQIIKLQLQ